MNREEFNGVVLKKMKEKGLIMSRVPVKTRDEFIKFAEEEFADDRGMLLHEVWRVYKQMINIQETFDVKLNYIIQLLESKEVPKEEIPKEKIKMLDGSKRMKGGEKNE